MLTPFKTTTRRKLFPSDCITLYTEVNFINCINCRKVVNRHILRKATGANFAANISEKYFLDSWVSEPATPGL